MTEMRIGDQTVRHDREATAAVYGTIEHGGAEICGCISCENFAVQRNLVHSASFGAVLELLGIDPNKEREVFEYGPVEDGWHLYGGSCVSRPPRLTVEFTSHVKWLLPVA